MDKQLEIIIDSCKEAKFHMVKFDTEFGKILNTNEITTVDLTKNEIHRSIEYTNGDRLFVYDLKPTSTTMVDNELQLLLNNLQEAKVIEMVYPNIFRWIYDGISIKAYAIIPSGDIKQHSTITRYGGTEMFMKILKQHLKNIGKMHKGRTPDYNFLKNTEKINETELCLGSINVSKGMYSVGINLSQTYGEILLNSKNNIHIWTPLNKLVMKYWAREINPDFISEAKHIKLTDTIPIDDTYKIYPPCVKNLMKMKHKGNFNRFILARYLLSIHKPQDAKFVYFAVLANEEREHIKQGNCSSQWNYILNNMKRYDCPTCQELRRFCPKTDCGLNHPLEEIQEKILEKKDAEKEKS